MSYNLGAILSILVASQLFFVAMYLFTHQKGNKRNNRILGLLFLIFAISLFDFTIRVSGYILPIPLLHFIDDGFFLLYGPLIYFYVQGVVYRDFIFKIRDTLHLIPFLVYLTFIIYLLIFIDHDVQLDVANKVETADLPAWIFLAGGIVYLHILCYLWFGWRTLKLYQSIIKDKFSSIDEINLGWLSFMIKAFMGITIVAMIHNTMPIFGNVIFRYASLLLLLIASFYLINRVLVKALNQPAIFSGITSMETEKYASSNLTQVAIDDYRVQLEKLMEGDKIYLNAELTSQELAKQLNISPRELSQVINQGFDKNFFDFVNTYRCEEVKYILKGADKKVTILEAMYQAGFNSKSSFNKEFKKLTGLTPSEFRKRK